MEKHCFSVRVDYTGGIGGGGGISTAGLESRLSVPTGLGGSGAGTNPEELLVGAASSCYAITLSAMAARKGLPLDGLELESEGLVASDRGLRLERIMHRPTMHVSASVTTEERASLLELARAAEAVCMVSMALRGNVVVEIDPTLVVR